MPKAEGTATKAKSTRKAAGEGKAKRAKKDPNAPKKPLSAYMLFCQENRDKIKEENPDMKFGAIGKELGNRWKDATEDDKKRFNELVVKDKARYEREIAAYNANSGAAGDSGGADEDDDDE